MKSREIAIYLSRKYSRFSGKELGEFFGGISVPAITMKYSKIKKEITLNKKVLKIINRIKLNI